MDPGLACSLVRVNKHSLLRATLHMCRWGLLSPTLESILRVCYPLVFGHWHLPNCPLHTEAGDFTFLNVSKISHQLLFR